MPFLKLQTNISVSIILTHDQPIKKPGFKEGTFQYLYGIEPMAGGDTWGATQSAYDLIQKLGLGKGSKMTVVKEEIEGTNAKRFRINGKVMDDFKETYAGMTIAEAKGGALSVLIGELEGILNEFKAFAKAQARVSVAGPEQGNAQQEQSPPSYDEEPPVYHEEMPFPNEDGPV